jgi:hypothetical protein
MLLSLDYDDFLETIFFPFAGDQPNGGPFQKAYMQKYPVR